MDFGSLNVEEPSKRFEDDESSKKSIMTVFHKTEITPDIWKIMAQRTKVKEALKEMYDMGVADGVNKARTHLKSRV